MLHICSCEASASPVLACSVNNSITSETQAQANVHMLWGPSWAQHLWKWRGVLSGNSKGGESISCAGLQSSSAGEGIPKGWNKLSLDKGTSCWDPACTQPSCTCRLDLCPFSAKKPPAGVNCPPPTWRAIVLPCSLNGGTQRFGPSTKSVPQQNNSGYSLDALKQNGAVY